MKIEILSYLKQWHLVLNIMIIFLSILYAEPSRIVQSLAEPSLAEPIRAVPSRAEPTGLPCLVCRLKSWINHHVISRLMYLLVIVYISTNIVNYPTVGVWECVRKCYEIHTNSELYLGIRKLHNMIYMDVWCTLWTIAITYLIKR